MRTYLTTSRILPIEVSGPLPVSTANAENHCILEIQISTNTNKYKISTLEQILAYPGQPVSDWGLTAALLKTPGQCASMSSTLCTSRSLQTESPFNFCLIHTEHHLCRKGHFTATCNCTQAASEYFIFNNNFH